MPTADGETRRRSSMAETARSGVNERRAPNDAGSSPAWVKQRTRPRARLASRTGVLHGKMSSLDYLDLCRLCLVKDRVSVPIFEGEGDVRQIFLKIAACLPVKVAREDKLPKKICDDCVYKVELFYQFWNTTANAEKQLLQWLGEVGLEEKQGYVTGVLNPSVMKQEQNSESRLDSNVMQQVSGHQDNMGGMTMIDNMGLGMPIMIPSGNQQQITSVPMDTSGNSVQTVRPVQQAVVAVAGPSAQPNHQEQLAQNQGSASATAGTGTNPTTATPTVVTASISHQDDEEDTTDEDENSDEECDADEGLPVKEESEEDPSNNRTIEPTTFVNVSLACDEAGPSGLQQQKITEMPEMSMPQAADGDPKSGAAAGREARGKRRLLKSDAYGCFILGENSVPMRLWQLSDSHGNLRYSLVPASDDSSGRASRQQELIVSSNIKVEVAEEFVGVGGTAGKAEQAELSSEESRYLGSLAHLCEVAIECFSCDTCTMKFPVESMLLRHKFHHRRNFRTRRLFVRNKKISLTQNLWASSSEARSPNDPIYMCRLCSFRCDRRVILGSHVAAKHSSARLEKEVPASRTCSDLESRTTKTTNRRQSSKLRVVLARGKKKGETRQVPEEKSKCCGDSVNVDDNDENDAQSVDGSTEEGREEAEEKDEDQVEGEDDGESKKGLQQAERNYRCDVCSFETSRNDKYQKHLRIHKRRHRSSPRGMILSCARCDFRCKNAPNLDAHVARKHDANEQCQCNICDFKCAKKSTLYSHMRRHRIQELGNMYSCNECGFKTGNKTSLYSHIKRKHKSTRSASGVKAPEFFFCNQCDYKNKNKYELKVHVARKHTEDFKFSCETCGKKFKVKGDLTNHIRFTHKEQPVICDVCGKTCLNSNSLYVHQKFAHYKAKYECGICKRRMVSQENLDEHMLRQHEKRENVVCEECGKTFSRNSRLKVHMRIHTGDKPYACTICNKSFARRTALKQHLLIHTGVRPYVCDICGKAFTQKPGLISHRKSHPGSHPPLPRVLIDHILNDVMNN
ncbi:uncharacterized protein LOC107265174 isoform X1 [Cephus cinctus]|uniref:Uncharacterized protein LOC107265174 isoform X1 n=1 Tax=Cephus cinctus TaxID=211228 RepID=A0AAJ7FFW3_CEPCN|nr:uncharacterized protein LOC107265174 isoform X1 [Cephus cinctus]